MEVLSTIHDTVLGDIDFLDKKQVGIGLSIHGDVFIYQPRKILTKTNSGNVNWVEVYEPRISSV